MVATQAVGDKWLITSGLKPGDKVIVSGLQKVRPASLSKRKRSVRRRPCNKDTQPCLSFYSSTGLRTGAGHHYDDCRRPAILQLPIAQYPTIAPPAVAISATYPGADAQTVQDTVTRVIEQNMNGIDNLMYMSSTSDSAGSVTITLTFKSGTDPDIARTGAKQTAAGHAAAAP